MLRSRRSSGEDEEEEEEGEDDDDGVVGMPEEDATAAAWPICALGGAWRGAALSLRRTVLDSGSCPAPPLLAAPPWLRLTAMKRIAAALTWMWLKEGP